MKVNVIMPQLGESVAEGTILKWLKQVGDPIARDENILEISTDKVDSEIPASAAGILVEILAQEGETIAVGKTIAVIETDATQVQTTGRTLALPKAQKEDKAAVEPVPVPYGTAGEQVIEIHRRAPVEGAVSGAGRRFYSPLVRKMAQEQGISEAELGGIPGSGSGGRVGKQDLIAYLEKKRSAPVRPAVGLAPQPKITIGETAKPSAPPAAGLREEIIPMDIMRRRIADHMVKSAFTAPHVTSVSEADMTNIVSFRERVKAAFEAREGYKLTYTPIIIEAAIKALQEYPYLNASLEGDNIILKHYINFGVAVALENGLIVPVVKGADEMNLLALARAVNDLSTRARTKRLSPDDVRGSTFSLTNPGIFGNLFGTPIINQPNVAILGIGAIKKYPVVLANDAIAIRPLMYLSLSYDHRIIDGALGGQFLQRLAHYLENFDPLTTI